MITPNILAAGDNRDVKSISRRALVGAVAVAASAAEAPVVVPVRRLVDGHAKGAPEDLARFWRSIWPEAVRDFDEGGVRLQITDAPGEIKRTAADRPVFVGLEP